MKAREIVSYIHPDMNKTYGDNEVICHGSILKDWSRNDAFLPAHYHELGAMRIEYDDEIKGFHDLTFTENRFKQYIDKAEADAEEDVC